jgi:hypothetical protein
MSSGRLLGGSGNAAGVGLVQVGGVPLEEYSGAGAVDVAVYAGGSISDASDVDKKDDTFDSC